MRRLAHAHLLIVAFLALHGAARSMAPDGAVVRPTGSSVPANLLRLSISFAVPPSGAVLPRLALVTDGGRFVTEPFLEQELWSPDGRTLTVLMHPGRVKTGLVANEERGRALTPGKSVTLTLDGSALRRWSVTDPDLSPPDPGVWRTIPPRRGSRDTLIVRLDGPVDALDGNLIAVRAPNGDRLEGRATLGVGETEWRFVPRFPWAIGRHVVVAAPDLEDAAGNRPGQDFEHRRGAVGTAADGPAFEPRA